MSTRTQINIRCTDEQWERWKECADLDRRKMADWARLMLDDAANNILGAKEPEKGKRKS